MRRFQKLTPCLALLWALLWPASAQAQAPASEGTPVLFIVVVAGLVILAVVGLVLNKVKANKNKQEVQSLMEEIRQD